MEVLDLQESVADLVHFLNAPAGMIQVGQGVDAVVPTVEQGGGDGILGSAAGVLYQARPDRSLFAAGVLAGQVAQGVRTGQDGCHRVGPAAREEAVKGLAGAAPDAEHGMQARSRWAHSSSNK